MASSFTQAQALGQCELSLVTLTDGYKLHQSVVDDWHALVSGAQSAGFELAIVSSYRSFEQQLAIWNSKASGQRRVNDRHNKPLDIATLNSNELLNAILTWSALPGASRHHWGCDIDVFSPTMLTRNELQLEPWEYQHDGPMAALGKWLDNNLTQYGFFRPYRVDRGGVAIEPWHISHQTTAQYAEKKVTQTALIDAISGADIRLKPQILDTLDDIYKRYVINTEPP